MLAFLAKCSAWVDEIPPLDQPMRFGNKAFRIWLEKIEEVNHYNLRSKFYQKSNIKIIVIVIIINSE